jgi:hypothetical protein
MRFTARVNGLDIVIGFDFPMQGYFLSIQKDDEYLEDILCFEGATPEQLEQILNKHIHPSQTLQFFDAMEPYSMNIMVGEKPATQINEMLVISQPKTWRVLTEFEVLQEYCSEAEAKELLPVAIKQGYDAYIDDAAEEENCEPGDCDPRRM